MTIKPGVSVFTRCEIEDTVQDAFGEDATCGEGGTMSAADGTALASDFAVELPDTHAPGVATETIRSVLAGIAFAVPTECTVELVEEVEP